MARGHSRWYMLFGTLVRLASEQRGDMRDSAPVLNSAEGGAWRRRAGHATHILDACDGDLGAIGKTPQGRRQAGENRDIGHIAEAAAAERRANAKL